MQMKKGTGRLNSNSACPLLGEKAVSCSRSIIHYHIYKAFAGEAWPSPRE